MITVHRESHGMMPAEIIGVSENDVIQFLGHVHEPNPESVREPALVYELLGSPRR